MDKNIRQILNSSLTKQSVNKNTFLNIQINGNERLLPLDNINKIVDLGEQFNKERQTCEQYRILGKITPLITNVLFNTTGNKDCWEYLSTSLFTNNSFDEDQSKLTFGESIKKNLKEIDGWYGYRNPVLTGTGLCSLYDMEPKRDRFSFTPDTTNSNVNNWNLTITYPYSADTQHYLINGGLLIIDKSLVTVGGREMTGLAVPVFHNLTNGGIIILTGTNMDGKYEVKRVGLDNGTHKNYYFCIDIDFSKLTISSNSRMLKQYNNITSEYYFRKFKKIKTSLTNEVQKHDYEIYNLAFSENIFDDKVYQFIFNENIDITNLKDNLGRPLSEIYLTIIKTDSNGIFSCISSGIEAPVIPELNDYIINPHFLILPIIQKIHNLSPPAQSYTPLELVVDIDNIDFYGDIVEYNITTLEEVVLSDIQYRFSTINRETTSNSIVSGPRPEGYYYKPHNLMRIKNFSTYIEQGNQLTSGMPEYSTNLGDGRYLWRDLLDIGVVDIKKPLVDYPFANGYHYLYQNYCFDIKRQDPFDNWNMYHSKFPPDPIGNLMTNNFKVNRSSNVC